MWNDVSLIGRLTKEPILRGDENKVGLFTIAVNRKFTNSDGKREADFIQIKTFKKLAENCSKFLKKGSLVGVKASIRTGSYQKDGKTQFTMEIIADDVQFLDGKKTSENDNSVNNESNQHNNYREDEDPFAGGTEIGNGGEWPFS